jgi:hypothetical protein
MGSSPPPVALQGAMRKISQNMKATFECCAVSERGVGAAGTPSDIDPLCRQGVHFILNFFLQNKRLRFKGMI